MAEDVNIVGRGYDEDLCENLFFKYMQTKQKQLYDEAARNRWTVSSFKYKICRYIISSKDS